MTQVAPGKGPLFGAGSAFSPAVVVPRLRARETKRLAVALAAIEGRELEKGWKNPSLRQSLDALRADDRERLLLSRPASGFSSSPTDRSRSPVPGSSSANR
jgi:hypothetical protein